MLCKLIFSGRHDQLQHLADALVSVLGIRLILPADLAPLLGLIEEFLPRFGTHLHRPQEVQTPIDQLLRGQRALSLEPVDNGADTWQ